MPRKLAEYRSQRLVRRRKFFNSKQPFYLPAAQVTSKWPSILRFLSLAPVRGDQFDAFISQSLIQWVRVISLVSDQTLGQCGDMALNESGFDQRGLIRRSARNPDGERKTMAVRDCHDLGPFAAACWTNAIAPFFAPAKVASTNASSKPSSPRASRSSHSAHKMPSSTPARCHC